MKKSTDTDTCKTDFRCPECHRPLKPPRLKSVGRKALICGGCGREFGCDEVAQLEKSASQGS